MSDLMVTVAFIEYVIIVIMIVELYYHCIYLPNMRRAAREGY